MAITYVGVGAGVGDNLDTTGARTLNPPLPAGLAVGDIMVMPLFLRNNAGSAVPTVTGWTKINHTGIANTGTLAVYWRAYQAGDASPNVTINDVTRRQAQIAAFRGVETSNPIGGIGWTTLSSGNSQNIGAITGGSTAYPGEAVLVFGFKRDDWTSVDVLSGDSLTWNEIAEYIPFPNMGHVWDYAIAGAGGSTISSKTFTVTGGAAIQWLGQALSLRPAAPEAAVLNVADTAQARELAAVAQPWFPTTPVLDDFERTESPLSQSGNWVSVSGVSTDGDEAVLGAGSAAYRNTADIDSPEAWTTIGNVLAHGLRLRFDPATNNGYGAIATANGIQVQRYTAGAGTPLGFVEITGALGNFAAGDKWGARMVGSQLDLFVKRGAGAWTQIGSVSDSTYTTGKIGMAGIFGTDRLAEFGGGATDQRFFRTFGDTATLTDAAAKGVGKSLADTAQAAEAAGKGVGKGVADTAQISETVGKAITLSKADTATLVEALSKAVALTRGDTAQISETYNAGGGLTLFIADTISITEDIGKAVSKAIDDTATVSEVAGPAGEAAPITDLPTGGLALLLSYLGQALEPSLGASPPAPATGGAPSEPSSGGLLASPELGGVVDDDPTGTMP